MIKENTYFEGGVKSLAFNQSGADVSVGVMAAARVRVYACMRPS